jgi:hypothetical protein
MASLPQATQDVEVLVHDFDLHGWCIIDNAVPAELCKPLHEHMMKLMVAAVSNRGQNRFCVNSYWNIDAPAFWSVLCELLENLSVFDKFMCRRFGEAWWLDSQLGGDVVGAFAPHSTATQWHTDWSTPSPAVVAVSIFVHAVAPDNAPLHMLSNHSGAECMMTGDIGQMIVRDVNTIHRGSINAIDIPRCLPAIRFITTQALRLLYKPDAFVPSHVFNRFPPRLAKRAHFLECVNAADAPQEHACQFGVKGNTKDLEVKEGADTNLIGQFGVEGNTKDLEVKVEHGGLDHQHCDRRGVRHVWEVNRKAVLINNTGTVEKSGTTFGLKAMAEGADTNLIGKFGVEGLLPQILRAGG